MTVLLFPKTEYPLSRHLARGKWRSSATKGNPNRLGADGPRHPLNVPANVVNIDASEIVGGIAEHSYYLHHARVIEDMNGVLAGASADQFPRRRYMASQYVRLAK
jgi:hypothetical protein